MGMNDLIKNQLRLTKKINIETPVKSPLIIKKVEDINLKEFHIGECFIIELASYILNPPDGFTLHENWNNNQIPKNNVMKIQIIGINGKMIKVSGFGYDITNKIDLPDIWTGWLPRKSFTILQEI